MEPRLLSRYNGDVREKLSQEFGYQNVHQVPRITKMVVNVGLGEATQNPKLLDNVMEELSLITGQKPAIRRARKSVANFRLRAGSEVGCKVTLRRQRMYEFLDRLISLALPRVRDFRGLSDTAFDGNGNYSLGLPEQLVFPELNPDKYVRVQGMNIAICTTATSNQEARELLAAFGFPFKRDDDE